MGKLLGEFNKVKTITNGSAGHISNFKAAKSSGTTKGSFPKSNLIVRVFSSFAVFSFAFLVSYLASSNFAPISNSDATGGINIVTNGLYYANITSSGSIDLSINSTPDGAYNLGKDSLSISTNSTLGYKLYISTSDHSSDSPALSSTTLANSLINTTDSTKYVSPSTGTISTPTLLETNTWGYTTSRSTSSDASTTYTKTDAAPTQAEGGQLIWRAVPIYGSEDLFYSNTSPSTSSTNSVDVYYAANVSTALPSGEYTNTVVYTAIVEGTNPSTSTDDITITPITQNGLAAGQQVTITTGIYSGFDLSNLGTISVNIGTNACTNITLNKDATSGNLVITCNVPAQTTPGYKDVTVTLSKSGQTYKTYALSQAYRYTPVYNYSTCASTATGSTFVQDGVTYIKLADGNCWTKDGQGNMSWRQASALNTNGASSVCPSGTHIPSAQEYDTLLSKYGGIAYSANGLPYGYYSGSGALHNATGWNTVFVSSTEYEQNKNQTWGLNTLDTNAAGVTQGGSKDGIASAICVGGTVPEFYTITDMQQMNHDICASVPAPTLSNMTNVITKANWTASSAGTPQTTLVDTRSGTALTSYTVRKLPDGKCWMTRNLRYAPTTATTLSSDSSDILSSNTWQMPPLGTYTTASDGDEVYEGSQGATYDATYYTWHTATAGTGTTSVTSGNTSQSICPKNWRLPTGGNGNGTTEVTVAGDASNLINGDYKQLDIGFGGTGANNQSGASHARWGNNTYGFNASRSGYFYGNAGATGSGLWWSSSAHSSGVAYNFYFTDTIISPQSGQGTSQAFTLRCLAR